MTVNNSAFLNRGPKQLSAWLNVQPGEGRLVALLFSYAFLLGLARIFVRTAAFSLFLVKFGPAALPYAYLGSGLGVALVSYLYFKLGQRLSLTRLLYANLGILVVGTAALRLALVAGGTRLAAVLPIWFDVVMVLTTLAIWPLVGYLFNLRQVKRLLGLIGTGISIAVGLGGLLVPALVRLGGAPNLILMAALTLAGALGLLTYLINSHRAQGFVLTSSPAPADRGSFLALMRDRYIAAMAGLVLLFWLAYPLIDNMFYLQTQVRYPEPDRLAAFLGLFAAGSGVFTVLARVGLTGPILNRFGVRTGLLIMPVMLFLEVGLVSALLGGPARSELLFWLVALTKGSDSTLRFSIGKSAQLVLYQPLSSLKQVQTQTLVESIYPLALGLGGLGLLLLDPVSLTYLLLLVLAGWIGIVFWIDRQYPRVLEQALAKRILGGETPALLLDTGGMNLLKQALQHPEPNVVLYALRVLRENEPRTSFSVCSPALLSHSSPAVQQEALRYIEQLRLVELRHLVEEIARRPGPGQIRALRTLLALGETLDLELYLRQQTSSPIVDERRQAAQLLGQVGVSIEVGPLLARLLTDEDEEVRQAALYAAGQAGCHQLWPQVIAALKDGSNSIRRAARRALIAGGEQALPAIQAAFNPGQDRLMIMGLIEVCGKIDRPAALALLSAHLTWPDEEVRSRLYASLAQGRYRTGEPAQRTVIIRQIELELAQYVSRLATLIKFQNTTPTAVALIKALERSLAQTHARIFWLLSFLYGPRLLQISAALSAASDKQRAYAVELFELTVTCGQLRRQTLPLLERLPPTQHLVRLREQCPQAMRPLSLAELVRQDSRWWLRACALYTAGAIQTAEPDLIEAVAAYLVDPTHLIRETAHWAAARLDRVLLVGAIERLFPPQIKADISVRLAKYRTGGAQMLSTVEKVLLFTETRLGAGLPDDSLVDIAAHAELVRFGRGEIIFEAGSPGHCMYVIAAGSVDIRDNGRVLDQLGRGAIFGEMALLDRAPRLATAIATTDTQLLQLDQALFFELLEYPAAALGISRVLSGWLRSRQGQAQAQADSPQADSDESSGGSRCNSASSMRVVSLSSEGVV